MKTKFYRFMVIIFGVILALLHGGFRCAVNLDDSNNSNNFSNPSTYRYSCFGTTFAPDSSYYPSSSDITSMTSSKTSANISSTPPPTVVRYILDGQIVIKGLDKVQGIDGIQLTFDGSTYSSTNGGLWTIDKVNNACFTPGCQASYIIAQDIDGTLNGGLFLDATFLTQLIETTTKYNSSTEKVENFYEQHTIAIEMEESGTN
jgi:hypothetical protein